MAVLRRDDNSIQLQNYLNAEVQRQIAQQLSVSQVMGTQSFNPVTGQMEMGVRGLRGNPGNPGPPGKEMYMLTYCGIHVKVPLDKSTFDLIEDATCLNGDELQLIKVVNEQDWKTIRAEWSKQWQQDRAFAAFEEGLPSGEYF